MDGDGQHDAGLLDKMLVQLCENNADIVVASRYRPDTDLGLTGFRRALSMLGVGLSRCVIGAHTSDPLSGFFFQTREWFKAARPRLSGVGFKILIDVLARGTRKPKVAEVSTTLGSRVGGESKLDFRISVEMLAQLIETATHGVVSSRFVMFGGVGITGLAVHLSILELIKSIGYSPFWVAQAVATVVAMISNYSLNNLITFRDLRLSGSAWWAGLARFAIACASGALLSQALSLFMIYLHASWLLAGGCGAVGAAIWNYWTSSRLAWRVGNGESHAIKGASVDLPSKEAERPL